MAASQYVAQVACDEKCCVCLDDVSGGIFVSECKHAFHVACIQKHVVRNGPNCPMCRATWTAAPGLMTPSTTALAPTRTARRLGLGRIPSVNFAAAADGFGDPEWEVLPDELPSDQDGGRTVRALRPDWVETQLLADLASIPAGGPTEVTAVVSLEASDGHDTAAIDVVIAADVSGSMSGAKVNCMKESLIKAADLFRDGDRVALIAFDHKVKQVMALRQMNEAGRAALKAAAGALTVRGGTDLRRALSACFEVVSTRTTVRPVCHVLLLTDGEDSSVRGRIGQLFAAEHNCVVSTLGYGEMHDATVLGLMAERGNGTYTSVPNSEAFAPIFGGYLGDATSVAAVNAVTTIAPASPCVAIESVSGPGRCERGADGSWTHTLPFMLSGAKRDILIKLKAEPPAGSVQAPLLRVATSAHAVGGARASTEEQTLDVGCGDCANSQEYDLVAVVVNRALVAEAAREAAEALRRGNQEAARASLAAARQRVRGDASLATPELDTLDIATEEPTGMAQLNSYESAYRTQQTLFATPSVQVSARASRLATIVSTTTGDE